MTVTNAILGLCLTYIAFGAALLISDALHLRARRRRAARRRRLALLEAYSVNDGRAPLNRAALAHDNVVPLHKHSVKV